MTGSTRTLDTVTLNNAARDWAGQWLAPTIWSKFKKDRAVGGREWVLQSFWNATYMDEFEHILAKFREYSGPAALAEFDIEAKKRFEPRSAKVFADELATRLAIGPDGKHIPGQRGTVQVGQRIIGHRPKLIKLRNNRIVSITKKVREPIFAGDAEEAGFKNFAHFLADQAGAFVMNISAEMAIATLDAAMDVLDNEAGAAVIKGYTGAQPLDPDDATIGTLCFTLVCSATAFNAAADQADGTVDAAAAAITDDTSADFTGTLGYVRASSSADGAAETDPQIDGEAGVSGADFNFNTLAIVSGATITMTSWVVTLPQGSTAT